MKQVGKTKNKLGLGLMAEDLREGLTEAQQKAKAKLPDLLYQSREEKVAEQMAARAKRVSEPLPWEPKVAATGKVLENPAVEGRQFVQEMADEARRIKDPQNNSLPFEDVLNKATDVKNKVHIFDYLRTPQNVLNKIGMGDEAKLIDKKWNDYLDDLPIEINKVTEWSKRAPRESKEIFRWLDGNKTQTLSPEAKTVALEIQDYLKSWADKLQLPEDKRVSDYITRIFDKDFSGKEFPDELAKLIQDTVPSSTYNPFTMKRLGAQGYKEDTWQALDAYIKRSVRAYHMDQALSRVSMKASTLETTQYNYVKRHIDQIQMRPTEIDTLIDNFIKSSPVGYRLGQRPVAAVTQKARQMVYRGLIGLNPKIALQNLTQASNTYSVLGERYTLLGYSKVAQNLPKFLLEMETELEKTGLLRENIIQDRTINATRKTWEKADKGLFYLFSNAEKINRGAAYWGAKAKALDQGKSEAEAIRFAKDIVATTQFEYSRISTPVALGSDLAKTFFQFASFPVKQTEFLAGLAKKKDFAGLIRWTASSFAMVYTLGQLWGMKLEDLNPLGRYTEKGILGLPTPPTLQLPNEVYKSAVNAPDQYGNVSDEQNPLLRIAQSPGVLKGVMNYIPAGGQIMKSYQGIKSYQQGESLTPSGRTRFEIPQTSENAIKTALFGQYAVKEGRDYIENLGKSANVKFVETIGLEGNQLKEAKQKLKGQSAFSDRQKASIKKGGVDVMDTILERREKTKTLKAVIADYDSVNAQIKELVVSGRPEEARPLIIQNRELLAKGKVMKNFETRYNKLYMSLEALYANPRLSTEQKAKVATVLKKQIETLDIAYKNFNSR